MKAYGFSTEEIQNTLDAKGELDLSSIKSASKDISSAVKESTQEAAKEAAETVKEVAKETSSDYRSGLTDTGKAIYDSMSAYGFTQDEINSTIEAGGHKK